MQIRTKKQGSDSEQHIGHNVRESKANGSIAGIDAKPRETPVGAVGLGSVFVYSLLEQRIHNLNTTTAKRTPSCRASLNKRVARERAIRGGRLTRNRTRANVDPAALTSQ